MWPLNILDGSHIKTKYSQDTDEPLLELLQDIKITFSEKEPMGFTLNFHFAKNDFFTNSVLTKQVISRIVKTIYIFQRLTFQYDMKCLPDPEDPFSFEGPEIFKCVGCPIDWLPGKNLTVKQVILMVAQTQISR